MIADLLLRQTARGLMTVARTASRSLGGPRPQNDRGVFLDAQTHLMLTLSEKTGQPRMDELGSERGRVEMVRQVGIADIAPVRLDRVEDRRIPGEGGDMAIRIYAPRGGSAALPAIVYYHGGGFVIGGLESHDRSCRILARNVDAIVVSIDYRLAPEAPFPAAALDACAAFRWVHAHAAEIGIDPHRIAVAGDSAGGNLAAVVCQVMRDEGHAPPAFQLLIYPATDLSRSCESHATFADGFFLTHQTMDWFLANYLTHTSEERDPRGSPLVTADLSGLPTAHVVVAGFDPLRDEGEAYARALMAAGVPTTLRCYGSLIHGFLNMGGLVDAARHAVDDITSVTRARLHRS